MSTDRFEQAKASPVQAEALLAGILAAAKAALPQGLDVLVWGAARLGDQATLRHLLANGGGTSWTYPMDGDEPWRGSSCLWAASRGGHEGAVKELLESGVAADEAKTDDRTTPLTMAASEGHQVVVEQLVAAGADVNKSTTRTGVTPLYMAAREGREGVVEQLLKAGADVDKAETTVGATPLHVATIGGHKGVVEVLLKAGANPNAKLVDDRTPLILATENGHGKVCSILLEAGANQNHVVMAIQHRNALKIAVKSGCQEVALVLMEHGSPRSSAILAREELEQLMRWSTEALKENNRQMEEKDAQMERLVQGIPEWCAQAAFGISSKPKEAAASSAASLPGILKWTKHSYFSIMKA